MTAGKNTDIALAEQLIAGTKKRFSNVSSLTLGNTSLTPAQVEAFLQTLVDLRTTVNDAKGAAAVPASTAYTSACWPRSRLHSDQVLARPTATPASSILLRCLRKGAWMLSMLDRLSSER